MGKQSIDWIGVVTKHIKARKAKGESAGVKDVVDDARKEWNTIKAGTHSQYVKGKVTRKSKKRKTKKNKRSSSKSSSGGVSDILSACKLCSKCTKKVKKHFKNSRGGSSGGSVSEDGSGEPDADHAV